MKDQLQTIRDGIEKARIIGGQGGIDKALTAVAQLEAMVREQKPVANCTNSDAWNCKYCRKATTCEALNDPRNFAAPVAQQPQVVESQKSANAALNESCVSGVRVEQPQVEAVQYTRADLDRAYSAGLVEGERLAIQQAEAVPAWTTEQITAVAQPIAMAIAENCRTAPQLVFPHLFLGLKDLLTGTTPQQAEAVPNVCASFYTESPELIGTTEAPIKRVEREDDGTLHVYIDHWPQQAEAVPQFVSCRCFDDVSKRLCADKNRCSQVVAANTAPQQAEAVPLKKCASAVCVNEGVARKCKTCDSLSSNFEAWNEETAQQAEAVPQNWRIVLPGGKHTDKWESARVADYNQGWNDYRKAAKDNLEKLEAAAQQAEAVPPGYVLVPAEPTRTMLSEGACAQSLPGPHYITESAAKACWKFMVAAAIAQQKGASHE